MKRSRGSGAVRWTLLFFIFLEGCGPPLLEKFTQIETVPESKAIIYVYQTNLTTYPYPSVINLNGKQAFRIRPGGYYPIVTEPGELELSGSMEYALFAGKPSITLDVVSGQVRYIKLHMIEDRRTERGRVRFALVEVPVSQAENEIIECRKVSPIQ